MADAQERANTRVRLSDLEEQLTLARSLREVWEETAPLVCSRTDNGPAFETTTLSSSARRDSSGPRSAPTLPLSNRSTRTKSRCCSA